MSRDDVEISREQVAFLGWSYELKNSADYGQDVPISRADAELAIAEAGRMVDEIAAALSSDGSLTPPS